MQDNIGRKNGLRMPREISNVKGNTELNADKIEISKAVSHAQNTKYKGDNAIVLEHPDVEKETKIPSDSSELIVITKAKKLTAYVITITEKSPKKFRAVFINRMQNYSLDCIENLIEANSIRMDSFFKIEIIRIYIFSCIRKSMYFKKTISTNIITVI